MRTLRFVAGLLVVLHLWDQALKAERRAAMAEVHPSLELIRTYRGESEPEARRQHTRDASGVLTGIC